MNTPVGLELDKLLIKKGIDMPVKTIIADVVMWLYEKHGIWIYPTPFVNGSKTKTFWVGNIMGASVETLSSSSEEFIPKKLTINEYETPTEAYEAAIEYTLNNLI